MKISYSFAHKIGGTGLAYIASKTVLASIKMNSLYQLFACDFDNDSASHAYEAIKIKDINEFELAHGLARRLLNRLGLTFYFSNLIYDIKVTKRIKPCDIFHALAAQSARSMIKAKRLGAKIIADNPTTHYLNMSNILEEEYKIWKVPYPPYNKIVTDRQLKAYDMADIVVVPSKLSYDSFIKYGYPEKRLRIVPYGVDKNIFKPQQKEDGIFRALFIGQIRLRKGFQYLLEAWKSLALKKAEVILIGSIMPDALYALRSYEKLVDFKIYGPLHDMRLIAAAYKQASIAVFPSIEDGFGMVVTEAMASGLPVVVSENTGAKYLIEHGKEGFIIPIRNPEAIKKAILYFYENENKRIEMGNNARMKIENQIWENYQDSLIEIYKELIENR